MVREGDHHDVGAGEETRVYVDGAQSRAHDLGEMAPEPIKSFPVNRAHRGRMSGSPKNVT